jgi:hypothetical protein
MEASNNNNNNNNNIMTTTTDMTMMSMTPDELLCAETVQLVHDNPQWAQTDMVRALAAKFPDSEFGKKSFTAQKTWFKRHCVKPLEAKGVRVARIAFKRVHVPRSERRVRVTAQATDNEILACLAAIAQAHVAAVLEAGQSLLDSASCRHGLRFFEKHRTVPVSIDTFKRRLGVIVGALPRHSSRFEETMGLVQLIGGPWSTRGNHWEWANDAATEPSLEEELEDDHKAAILLQELLGV